MNEYKIGGTFEELEYEEMTSSQTGVTTGTWTTQTITYCPILSLPTVVTLPTISANA